MSLRRALALHRFGGPFPACVPIESRERSSIEVPEPTGDFHDDEGFVYRHVTYAEAEANGWTPLTEEQQEHVRPLSRFDERAFDAIQARKEKV